MQLFSKDGTNIPCSEVQITILTDKVKKKILSKI